MFIVSDDKENDDETKTIKTMISEVSFRPKNETTEERRERKTALKSLQRDRRKEKKMSRLLFKEDKKRLIQREMNLKNSRWTSVV